MASLYKLKNGSWRVQYLDSGKRKLTITLGKLPRKAARNAHRMIDELILFQKSATRPTSDVAEWLDTIDDTLHSRLAAAGLADPRTEPADSTLGGIFDAFNLEHDSKATTQTRVEQAQTRMIEHFGEDRELDTITKAEASAWRAWMADEKAYSPATISRDIGHARQFALWAIRRGIAETNPFEDLKRGSQTNEDRSRFIDRDTIDRVIEQATSPQWRLLIALSRYQGLRVPGEAFALRWDDVDWERASLLIHSSKTAHHEGKGSRLVPIFPETMPFLREAFEAAEPGSERVLSDFRPGQNPHTQLSRFVTRAGFEPWPRLWHNLRASRQTEIADEFPEHLASRWLGNSPKIFRDHYARVTDEHWKRATGGCAEKYAHDAESGTEQVTAGNCTERKPETEPLGIPELVRDTSRRFRSVQTREVGKRGLEPRTYRL